MTINKFASKKPSAKPSPKPSNGTWTPPKLTPPPPFLGGPSKPSKPAKK